MKPTREEITSVVLRWASAIPFFPKDELGQMVITEELEQFVGTQRELALFYDIVKAKMKDYERDGGLSGLRGIYCTQFKPLDGVYAQTGIAELQPEYLESQFRNREMEENTARIAEYRREAALAPPEDRKPFELPPVKKIS